MNKVILRLFRSTSSSEQLGGKVWKSEAIESLSANELLSAVKTERWQRDKIRRRGLELLDRMDDVQLVNWLRAVGNSEEFKGQRGKVYNAIFKRFVGSRKSGEQAIRASSLVTILAVIGKVGRRSLNESRDKLIEQVVYRLSGEVSGLSLYETATVFNSLARLDIKPDQLVEPLSKHAVRMLHTVPNSPRDVALILNAFAVFGTAPSFLLEAVRRNFFGGDFLKHSGKSFSLVLNSFVKLQAHPLVGEQVQRMNPFVEATVSNPQTSPHSLALIFHALPRLGVMTASEVMTDALREALPNMKPRSLVLAIDGLSRMTRQSNAAAVPEAAVIAAIAGAAAAPATTVNETILRVLYGSVVAKRAFTSTELLILSRALYRMQLLDERLLAAVYDALKAKTKPKEVERVSLDPQQLVRFAEAATNVCKRPDLPSHLGPQAVGSRWMERQLMTAVETLSVGDIARTVSVVKGLRFPSKTFLRKVLQETMRKAPLMTPTQLVVAIEGIHSEVFTQFHRASQSESSELLRYFQQQWSMADTRDVLRVASNFPDMAISEKEITKFFSALVSDRLIRGEMIGDDDTVDLAVGYFRTGLRHEALARWLGERLLAVIATVDKEGRKFTTPKYRGLLDSLIAAEVTKTFSTSTDFIGAPEDIIEWAVKEDRRFSTVSGLPSLFLAVGGLGNVFHRLDSETRNALLVSACAAPEFQTSKFRTDLARVVRAALGGEVSLASSRGALALEVCVKPPNEEVGVPEDGHMAVVIQPERRKDFFLGERERVRRPQTILRRRLLDEILGGKVVYVAWWVWEGLGKDAKSDWLRVNLRRFMEDNDSVVHRI